MAGPSGEVRQRVLDRDLHRCVWCGRYLRDGEANLHHRLLRSHGTDNQPSNLLTVCGSGTTGCHGKMHANPAKATARGHIVPSWGAPALVVVHTWRGRLTLDDDYGVTREL